MKLTLYSTDELTTVNGAEVRRWTGETAGGVPVIVFIARIAVPLEHDGAFQRERRDDVVEDRGYGATADGPARATKPTAFLLRDLL